MSSEFDALAVEADIVVFDVHGHAAIYTPPGGTPISRCSVLIDNRDEDARLDDGRPTVGQRTIEVRESEVAQPVQGGRFLLDDGREFFVGSRPKVSDSGGRRWTMWAE